MRALVFLAGSFGWKFLYSATSFSIANNFFCRESRRVGSVSLKTEQFTTLPRNIHVEGTLSRNIDSNLPNMVGELMVESILQIGCAKLVGHVPVGGVREEELPLRLQSTANVLPSVDVFLSAVHHTHVS